ncbi:MAG TPA: homoserine kinase [Chloroflexota bacterium]|nr:homoserine kinase [Chloroflexota bacterium]
MSEAIVARVPATSANLGAGFDCFGLALGLYNDVELLPDAGFGVEILGEGAENLPRDRGNLVARTVLRYFETIGRPSPHFGLRLVNRIPMCGGLGSSSTALVGGLLTANHLAGGILGHDDLLQLAAEWEGHPDNVAPAMLGGFVLAVSNGGRLSTLAAPYPADLKAVLFLPRFSTSTREARRLLPTRVAHADAAFNVGRAALFVGALATGRLDLLPIATQDRLHQPYRQVLFPTMPRFFDAALEAGAHGAWLSGSGSALLALATTDHESVAAAFEHTAHINGVAGRVQIVDIASEGARIVSAE